MSSFRETYGPRAVVTGAAAGIGAAFARALAARGLDLVLVDRDAPGLEALATELSASVSMRVLVADLLDPADRARAVAALDDAEVHLLVNNAGVSELGAFVDVPLAAHERTLALNCGASLALVHAAATRFVARGRGGIVLLSSNSGVIHSPYVAHYAGTKAWALALGEAIHEELRPRGVDVLVVVPGLTRTPGLLGDTGFDERAAGRLVVDADVVAERSLARLGKDASYAPNPLDRLGAAFMRALPTKRALALNARTMKRFFPKLR